jgi:nucleoside-diphosphate kinase
MEKTLAIIKPDAVQSGMMGTIIQRIENEGIKIVAMRLVEMDRRMAEGFYYVHRQKPFFDSLVAFMTSGPSLLLVLEGFTVIDKWRSLMGSTHPGEAAYGTIRRQFGTSIERNAVHGSDSADSAVFEINYFFKGTEILS